MGDRPILHPATYQRALDVEAAAWAARSDVPGWIAKMAPENQAVQTALLKFAMQCFVEGFDAGAHAVRRKLPMRFETDGDANG